MSMVTRLKDYKTRDLYEAAFIYAQASANFVGLEADGRDYLFVFKDLSHCKKLADTYYARTGQVVGKNFTDAVKTLKDLIFNRLRERRDYAV